MAREEGKEHKCRSVNNKIKKNMKTANKNGQRINAERLKTV